VDGDGHLVIQALKSGGNWYSARMKTEGIQNFRYGRIEASIKIPDTTNPGLWPAFWWLGSSFPTVPWPNCGEADIMENWSPAVLNGPGPARNRSSVHTALTGGTGIGATYNFPSGQAADAGFYAYGVIWSANMIQFYLNPTTTPPSSLRPFFIVTASDLPAGDTWPFNAGAFLLADLAVGGTLGGPTDNTPSPDAMTIDYVRQYTPSAVPAPALGSPPPLTVTAGATVDNTSTFTPSLAAGTGYVYFSCTTTAPKASCSIKTDDPLNPFVANSDASPPESVAVTVVTTSNAWGLPRFIKTTGWVILLVFAPALLLEWLVFARHARRSSAYAVVLPGVVLAATAMIGCAGHGPGGGGGAGSTGTAPGNYAVTVYAFTEANASAAANPNADASVTIPLTVN
jgi:beta-glucanase (GH16 family)